MDNKNSKLLRRHQLAMLDMLTVVDDICNKYEISYMLFAGTALGAIRHQGFVPWDDDLDIIMLREDYEYFLSVAPGEIDSSLYYLQKEYSAHWPMFFSKLRKNGTACIEKMIPRDPKMHQGIYIDIFPCDNLSNHKVMRKIQFLASKVVIAKGLDQRAVYLTNSKMKKVFIALCRCLPMKPFVTVVRLNQKKDTNMVHCFLGGASKYKKSIFPRKWFQQTKRMSFESKQFPVSQYYDEMLSILYGDYMTPTPVNERTRKVHAEIVDVEHSYKEYIDIQKKMKFNEYTRSIR